MKQIIECIARDDLHEAMVRCWRMLNPDANFPFFQEQERAALAHGGPYQGQKELIRKALLENEPLRIRNLPRQYPLAFLEVLDDYLFMRLDYSARFAPPARISIDGETYLFHRRILRRSIKTAHALQTGHLQSRLHHFWIIPDRIGGIEIRFRSVTLASTFRTLHCSRYVSNNHGSTSLC